MRGRRRKSIGTPSPSHCCEPQHESRNQRSYRTADEKADSTAERKPGERRDREYEGGGGLQDSPPCEAIRQCVAGAERSDRSLSGHLENRRREEGRIRDSTTGHRTR